MRRERRRSAPGFRRAHSGYAPRADAYWIFPFEWQRLFTVISGLVVQPGYITDECSGAWPTPAAWEFGLDRMDGKILAVDHGVKGGFAAA